MEPRSIRPTTFFQLKGYPGLSNMAPYIQPYIPGARIYVEPFAGLGRTVDVAKHERIVLNDLSVPACVFLREHFPTCLITSVDYEECIHVNDSPDTFFFLDPPWRNNIYQNNVEPVLTSRPREYYKVLLDKILPAVRGSWILCSDRAEVEIGGALSKSGYPNMILEHPTRRFFGRAVAVRLCSNKPFVEV
jgi:hypothetical protein